MFNMCVLTQTLRSQVITILINVRKYQINKINIKYAFEIEMEMRKQTQILTIFNKNYNNP